MKKRLCKSSIVLCYGKNLLILFFLLLNVTTYSNTGNEANTGTITGYVKDKKTGETLIGANVFIEGTLNGTTTDFDGKFTLSGLKPGTYDLKISFVSYTPIVLEKVVVESVKTTMVNIELEEVSMDLEGVTITAVKRQNTEMSMISSIKAAPLVVNGISNQQILRSQDKDASEVIKRLPGVTIIDDRFIVVRGLNQRYNSVWINNAATPSSETDAKAFSFDVIPSGMIDNIMVFKSGAPELPGDFAGGFIKISTKNMPEKNSTSIEVSGGYNSSVTKKEFKYYKGGKLDFLGFDDGTRALPANFPANLSGIYNEDLMNSLAKQMPNNWSVYNKKAAPDLKVGLNINRKFNINKLLVGSVTSLNYSNSYDNYDNLNNAYSGWAQDGIDTAIYMFKYADKIYKNSVKWSALNNWAFFLGNGNKIEFKNLLNQIGYTKTTTRQGLDEQYNTVASVGEMFLSRLMYSGQLSGEHSINEGDFKIDWNVGYAYANKLDPDRKMFYTKYDPLSGRYKAFVPPTAANPKSCGHLYQENYENIYSSGLNLDKKLNFKSTSFIKAGYYIEYKDRSFKSRNIGFVQGTNLENDSILYLSIDQLFAPENLDYKNRLRLAENTNLSDNYTASNILIAGYMAINYPITDKLNFYGGVRVEKDHMVLNSHEAGIEKPIQVSINKTDIFPSANLSYNFSLKFLARLAYFKSVNRPEFREIAPYVFYDYNENASISGNTSITNAEIHNFDFRLEYYPSEGESVSAAFFFKQFKNPIEVVYDETGGNLAYTNKNAESAQNKGIEIEIRKTLDFISLNNLSLVFNNSFIYSKVYFPKDSLALKVTRDRALQGQSKYVVNAGIYYDNSKTGLKFSLLYNVMGDRISIVGRLHNSDRDHIPDLYEMPRNLLDFTFSKTIGKSIEIKGGIKNILNPPYKTIQTFKYFPTADNSSYETREAINRSYSSGSIYSLGLVFKF